jgi:hypothetical protein
MGLWDAIKRSFQRESAKAAVKASAVAVASAAEQAADGLLTGAEADLAEAEKRQSSRKDDIVLPSTEVSDPDWLAEVRKTEAETRDSRAQSSADPLPDTAQQSAQAELARLKAKLLHIEE